jgi:hypothetical protein
MAYEGKSLRRGASPSISSLSPSTSNSTASQESIDSTSDVSSKHPRSPTTLRFLSFAAIASSASLWTAASSSTANLTTLNRGSSPQRSRKPTLISRGMDYVSARNRLAVLGSYFPHTDSISVLDNMEQIYCDMIELSRYVRSHSSDKDSHSMMAA